jgi:hypothetical protein
VSKTIRNQHQAAKLSTQHFTPNKNLMLVGSDVGSKEQGVAGLDGCF